MNSIIFNSQPAHIDPSLPGPENILRTQLSNGITILSRANFNSPSVVVQGYLTAGSISELEGKLGLAGFTASSLLRGTEELDFQQIFDALESVGASLYFSGGTHITSFGGKALVEDLDLLLKLITQSLRQPTFPNEHVERLRAQRLTGLAIRSQDTAEMSALAFDQIVYAGHPYRFPEDGYPETVASITRQELVDFHQRHYGPQGLVICVAGAIEPAEAVDKIERVLGDWRNPAVEFPPSLPGLLPIPVTTREKVTIPGKFQADLVIGAAGPPRKDTHYLAASLGNNILGQFGMMGRIGEVVREQAGLAYYASSSLSGGIGPGPWSVSAGVNPDNIERAIDLIVDEIKRFVSESVSDEELADSQANFIGQLPLSLESNHGVANALIVQERYDLGLDYYQRYPDLIRKVTVGEILATSRQYLDPDHLAIAVAGP